MDPNKSNNAFYKESAKTPPPSDNGNYYYNKLKKKGAEVKGKIMEHSTKAKKNLTTLRESFHPQTVPKEHVHNLVDYKFHRPTQCSQCNFFIIGFGRQGFTCFECGLCLHYKCLNSFLSNKNHEEIVKLMEVLKKKEQDLEDKATNLNKTNNAGGGPIKSARATWEIDPSSVELGQTLGTGAYGIVYKAKLHGVDVAVKLLNLPSLNVTEQADFENEVAIMKDIHHPNVILFMGACTQPGHLMIITEFAGMGSLEDLIYKPKVPLTSAQQLAIARETALGVNWLHNLRPPFLHRDLKPANILLDHKWTVKVADFGLATRMSGDSDDGRADVAGTPFYMAPEVLLETTDYDGKCDVYSFSIVLYELFAKIPPYKDIVFESFEEFVNLIANENERLELPANLNPGIRQLIVECWAPKAVNRPSFAQIIPKIDKLIAG
eukprot:TRINITY_DN12498_c0_g1_i1.p1 TRINITY_DN12498_c0_g1~~TRINITY_DN12498_c0_g1_i1.p1  ORF type:complete len:435 (-),score=73.22 TRINITY_DN12498_c0_g1_i1:72-1376(-)